MKLFFRIVLCILPLILLRCQTVLAKEEVRTAVYLGVAGYGSSEKNKDTKPEFEYNFFIDGETRALPVSNGEPDHDSVWTYDIQNTLQEGYLYSVTITDGTVTAAVPLEDSDRMLKGIIGKMGKKTINISSKVYYMTEGCRTFRITWAPGGSYVEEDLPTSGMTVRAIINGAGRISAMYMSPVSINRVMPVKGTPGLTTLRNFLATSLMPVGTTLYVFGGGWNWQDTGSSRLVTSIGVPPSWIDFFQAQPMNYSFKSLDYADGDDPANMDAKLSYYPYYGWNEYYYAGADCSAYIAWSVYNTLHDKSGEPGYLTNSRKMAKLFESKGWGTFTNEFKMPRNSAESDFKTGDIFSIDGHVWICVGVCDDGSIVILHSTPSLSYTNLPGGGPQLGAIGKTNSCDAWQTANRYMTTYYPDWSRRYPTTLKDYAAMTDIKTEGTGKFSWDLTGAGILTDPDGYADMNVYEILADLFGEG